VILVDSTVWIDHLNDNETPLVIWLRESIIARRALLLVGDLVLSEVLQGLSSEHEAAQVERALRRFQLVSLVGPDIAIRSAANYRDLRRRGITVRKTIDMLIGTWCIEQRHTLLHSDRDFDHLERHLGLDVIHP
jgi:predicted nucleic acid-binding protein